MVAVSRLAGALCVGDGSKLAMVGVDTIFANNSAAENGGKSNNGASVGGSHCKSAFFVFDDMIPLCVIRLVECTVSIQFH